MIMLSAANKTKVRSAINSLVVAQMMLERANDAKSKQVWWDAVCQRTLEINALFGIELPGTAEAKEQLNRSALDKMGV